MTKGRTGEQSAHSQAEEELFRLEHGGGGMGAGRRWVEGRWRLGGMLWQCSPSLLEGHQVLVRNSTRAGELETAGSLLGRKYFQPRECPVLAPALQPGTGSETNHQHCRTENISHAWENAAARIGQALEGGEMVPLHGLCSEPQPTAVLSCNHPAHNKNQRKEKGMPRTRGSSSSGTNPFS